MNQGKIIGFGVLILILLGAIIGGIWYVAVQNSGVPIPVSGQITSELLGKTSSLSTNARDRMAANTETRAAVPVYIANPEGEYIYTGGTSTSASAAVDFTNGITIHPDAYKMIAFNGTYTSKGMKDVIISAQAQSVNLDVYSIAADVTVTVFDENGVATSGGNNASLAANEDYTFDKVRIRNGNANSLAVLVGMYMDLPENTNISEVTWGASEVDDEGTMPLRRSSADDLSWAFKSNVELEEFDSIELSSLTFTADGDGTVTEAPVLYVVDGNYFYSSKGAGVLFGPETDASTPADVGKSDVSSTFNIL